MKHNQTSLIFSFLIILILSTGCADTKMQESLSTDTSLPNTNTSQSGTPVPPPIQITFDGETCTLSGPNEIPKGTYPAILNDESDIDVDFWVSQLLDGKSFQDAVDLQPEPGVYYPRPSWVEEAPAYFSFDSEVWIVVFENAGEYMIYVGTITPLTLWFCGPVWAIEG